jgi:protein-L-isoaspartate(D-aspartate) O-methyltransferase
MTLPYSSHARQWMLDGQLATNNITDGRLLDAIAHTPREWFVPEAFATTAYVDEEIPLGEGRYMAEPLALARMLQAVAIDVGETVLYLAGNTGYGVALASHLAHAVHMVEESPWILKARQAHEKCKLQDITYIEAAAELGAPQESMADVLIIEGAVQTIPPALHAQLRDGGRAVYVQSVQLRPGSASGLGHLTLAHKTASGLEAHVLAEVGMPRLRGFMLPPRFEFA